MDGTPILELRSVSLRYGERPALTRIELSVPSGQLVSLLGPSGSGKSSLLRVVAGLERPQGRVLLDGRDVTDTPPDERGVGLMFQDYALFPHRSVGANVAFGPRMRGWPQERIRARVREMLELVSLPGTEGRSISQLSGGEQQRVALARALAPDPRLLMLDEPMGSLDRSLRERLPAELRALFERLGVTVVYVTHDQEEAFSVADRIVVLRDGQVEADGAPETLWSAPPTAFTARFLGFRNLVEATVQDGVADTPWGPLPVPAATPPGAATIVLRPEALRLTPDGTLVGRVSGRRFRGDHVDLSVAVQGAPAGSPLLELEARGASVPTVGEHVSLALDASGVVAIPGGTV
jgi:thiamine transport system ATP-binding protein